MAHIYILHNYTVLCIICIVFSSSICMKDQFGNILPQLLQLEGLQTCGLLASIRAYPKLWEPVFVIGKGHQVTANSFIDSFDTVYSDSQVKREAEADTYTFFCDFVHSMHLKGKLNKILYHFATLEVVLVLQVLLAVSRIN